MAAQQQLGEEQVAPLMARLGDGDAAVQAAAVRALVSLPLDEDSWRRLGSYLLAMLGTEKELPPAHREALIGAAIYVPLHTVRARLRELAVSSDEDDRWLAALSLARTGDRTALPPLLQALQGDDEERWQAAAYALAGIDVSGHESDGK